MPPTRTAAVVCSHLHNAYSLMPTGPSSGIGHIRPRDLAVEPKPPRAPTTPAERFVAALLNGDRLGLNTLKGLEHLSNVTVGVCAEETKGEVEGIYQDPSTWTLVLLLKPDMFMTPLRVILAQHKGDSYAEDAPTWLQPLGDHPGQYKTRVRCYKWIQTFVADLLTTPHTTVPRVRRWGDILDYVLRIKEVVDMRYRTPRDPSCPRPKPRPRRSGNALAGAMAALSLEGGSRATSSAVNGVDGKASA